MSYRPGIFKRIYHAVFGRTTASTDVINLIKRHGKEQILLIKVCRRPLEKNIERAINIASLGGLERAKNELSYDEIFHLFLLVTTTKGTTFSIERNEIVRVTYSASDRNSECEIVPGAYSRGVSVQDFVENGYRSDPGNFFRYNPWTTNCQNFVVTILRANGLLTSRILQFVMQDAQSIKEHLPSYLQWSAPLLTELAARYRFLTGHGARPKFGLLPVEARLS